MGTSTDGVTALCQELSHTLPQWCLDFKGQQDWTKYFGFPCSILPDEGLRGTTAVSSPPYECEKEGHFDTRKVRVYYCGIKDSFSN